MTFYEKFVSQFDGCTYPPGSGYNCTAAGEAMWLYRASQGKTILTSCTVRRETGDQVGGTNLLQMQQVSIAHGITTGRLYQPIDFDTLIRYIQTGRYGSHLNISYGPVRGTPLDAFHGQFGGNHDIFLSRVGISAGTIRVGDPGAKGYADWPISLLKTAAARLDLGNGDTLGYSNAYAYLTPGDPVPQPYPGYGTDVPLAIRLTFPSKPVHDAIVKTGHNPGSVIGYADLVAAMKVAHPNYGTTVGVGDVQALLNWAANRG